MFGSNSNGALTGELGSDLSFLLYSYDLAYALTVSDRLFCKIFVQSSNKAISIHLVLNAKNNTPAFPPPLPKNKQTKNQTKKKNPHASFPAPGV